MKQTGAFPGERRFLLQFVAASLILAWVIGRSFHSIEWLLGYCIGVALISYGVAILRRVHVARRWPCEMARIVTSLVVDVSLPAESDEEREYRPLVVYEYRATAGPRQSDRFCVVSDGYTSPDRAIVQRLVQEYKPGLELPLHVCPVDPVWSVLRPDLLPRRRSHTWASIIGGGMVVAIAILSGWA